GAVTAGARTVERADAGTADAEAEADVDRDVDTTGRHRDRGTQAPAAQRRTTKGSTEIRAADPDAAERRVDAQRRTGDWEVDVGGEAVGQAAERGAAERRGG